MPELNPESCEEGDAAGPGPSQLKEGLHTLNAVWKRVLHVLLTPVADCRHRSRPRIVPDYSVLVLLSCLANPVAGAVVCALHKHAKNLYYKGQKRTANALYIILIILAHITIGVTTIFVALATAYFIIHGLSRGDESLGKLEADCFFSDVDDKKMKELKMTRREYCREKLSGNTFGKHFTDRSEINVIDKLNNG